MAELILVHGAWHGAWCWEDLIPTLQSLGHNANAIDLPGAGADRASPAAATLQSYAGRVADSVREAGDSVWLVGHSMGGVAISQAAEIVADHLAGLIYVTAFLPRHGERLLDLVAQDPESGLVGATIIDPMTMTSTVPPDDARRLFYGACAADQAESALARLRPQPLSILAEPLSLSRANFGRVPRYYVECLQDRALTLSAQRGMCAAAGVQGVASLNADHSPFYSATAPLGMAIAAFVAGQSSTI